MIDFTQCVIISDIDGTFLSDDKRLLARNLDARNRFCAGGGTFLFATGRTESMMEQTFPELIAIPNAPCILANGIYLYDFDQKERFCRKRMDSEKMREVLFLVQREYPDIALRICWDGGIWSDRRHAFLEEEFRNFPDAVAYLPIEEMDPEKIVKVVFAAERATLEPLTQILPARYGDSFTFTASESYFFEMMPPDTSKGRAIRPLKELIGKQKATVFAVGDYENDLDMLRRCDVPACPSNALEQVKRICRHHLCSNNEGAIADLIERLEQGIIII